MPRSWDQYTNHAIYG